MECRLFELHGCLSTTYVSHELVRLMGAAARQPEALPLGVVLSITVDVVGLQHAFRLLTFMSYALLIHAHSPPVGHRHELGGAHITFSAFTHYYAEFVSHLQCTIVRIIMQCMHYVLM
jgi:hypothetical protein